MVSQPHTRGLNLYINSPSTPTLFFFFKVDPISKLQMWKPPLDHSLDQIAKHWPDQLKSFCIIIWFISTVKTFFGWFRLSVHLGRSSRMLSSRKKKKKMSWDSTWGEEETEFLIKKLSLDIIKKSQLEKTHKNANTFQVFVERIWEDGRAMPPEDKETKCWFIVSINWKSHRRRPSKLTPRWWNWQTFIFRNIYVYYSDFNLLLIIIDCTTNTMCKCLLSYTKKKRKCFIRVREHYNMEPKAWNLTKQTTKQCRPNNISIKGADQSCFPSTRCCLDML